MFCVCDPASHRGVQIFQVYFTRLVGGNQVCEAPLERHTVAPFETPVVRI